jgi:hypothetical protein
LTGDNGDLRAEYSRSETRTLFAQHLPVLLDLQGVSRVLRELRERMGFKVLRATLKEAYGGRIPAKLRWKLLRMEIKRKLRKKRRG